MTDILKEIAAKILDGDVAGVENLTRAALTQKIDPQRITREGYIPALQSVGDKFSAGEIFLPEMLVSAMAVQGGMAILKPLLVKAGARSLGTIVLGSVKGDIHDIGKNLVGMMWEGAGFNVIDVGIDVSAERFIEEAEKSRADIIALSAIISTTRANMPGIIRAIRASQLGNNIKVMVGGPPVTQEFCEQIGADGYAPDANLAIRKAKELLGMA
jgi:5-methyltetrahydrofolate--homocysteine methyltransferase